MGIDIVIYTTHSYESQILTANTEHVRLATIICLNGCQGDLDS